MSAGQRSLLQDVARDTWRFFVADVDPTTHLPLDNLGPGATRGAYTSAANTDNYAGYGVEGLAFPAGEGLGQCTTCAFICPTSGCRWLPLDLARH